MMTYNVRQEMTRIRKTYYEHGDRATTVSEYRKILETARADPKVTGDDITVCLMSIGMVLHEQNRLLEAIEAYDEALKRSLNHNERARILQNKSVAQMAAHLYDAAVDTGKEALTYAQLGGNIGLVRDLIVNQQTIIEAASDKPEKIIVTGVAKRGGDISDLILGN